MSAPYPDTAEGARRLLRKARPELDPGDVSRSSLSPDPEVRHRWKADVPGPDGSRAFILYTSGHYIPVLRGTVEEIT